MNKETEKYIKTIETWFPIITKQKKEKTVLLDRDGIRTLIWDFIDGILLLTNSYNGKKVASSTIQSIYELREDQLKRIVDILQKIEN